MYTRVRYLELEDVFPNIYEIRINIENNRLQCNRLLHVIYILYHASNLPFVKLDKNEQLSSNNYQ